jgi:DNA-binding response OmpR family regulator
MQVAKLVKSIAEGSGFDARVVTVADAFFAAVSEWHPTHIALDLMMPDMEGAQVLASLANHGCRARVIITSGRGRRVLDATMRAGQEHGLDMLGALTKPYPAAALRELLMHDPE